MNFRYLKQFLAVVDHNGFTAAAAHLHTAQPAISRSIRLLEEELGVVLLDRGRRGLNLTAEGRAFARHARAILAQVDASREALAALQGLEAGHISLGAPPMVAAHLLPTPVSGFLTEHPKLSLSVVQAGAEDIREGVAQGRFDLGIVSDWRPFDGLVTKRLARHPIVACVAESSVLAAQSTLTWAELLNEPLICFPPNYYQRVRLEEAARSMGVPARIVAEVEAIPMILELVRRGHGVATLLKAAMAGQKGVIALGLPSDAAVPIALCVREISPLSAAARALHDFLVEYFVRGMPEDSVG